jgi:hypothetical protein
MAATGAARSGVGRGAAPDWLFWSFVFLSAVAFAYKAVARRQVGSALDQATACLSRRDAACVTSAIERARVYASGPEPRVDIAAAGLLVLKGQVEQAAAAMATVRVLPLEPKGRGEMLLVDGDIAAAKGQSKVARDDWTAARPLVDDDSLVGSRVSQAERDDADAARALGTELGALRVQLDELFDLAPRADPERLSFRTRDLAERLRHLPESDGRRKLLLSVEVASRASSAAARKRSGYFPAPLPAPVLPPEPDPQTLRYDPHARERQIAFYNQKLAEYEARKRDAEDNKAQREKDAVAAAASILEEATRLADEGLALLATSATPAPSATGYAK